MSAPNSWISSKAEQSFLIRTQLHKEEVGGVSWQRAGADFFPLLLQWRYVEMIQSPQHSARMFGRISFAVLALENWNTLDLFILRRYSRLWRRTYFLFLPFYLLSYLYAFSGSPFGMINLSHSLLSSIICEAQTSNFHLWAFILSKMQCW